MTYLDKTTNFSGNEATGFTYIFEDDSEMTLDMSGQIVDCSGMGSERAEKYAKQINKQTMLDKISKNLFNCNFDYLNNEYHEDIVLSEFEALRMYILNALRMYN